MHGREEGEGVGGVFLETCYYGGVSLGLVVTRGEGGLTVVNSSMAAAEAAQAQSTNSVVRGWAFTRKIGKLLVNVKRRFNRGWIELL